LEDETKAADSSNLPHPDMNIREIRDVYGNLGLSEDLIIAFFGFRTLGFLSNKETQKEDRWTRNPWVFDNNYFVELLDVKSPYLKTASDKAIVEDNEFRKWIESFANDQNLFFDKFSEAYVKISELGASNLLAEN
jgi:L-ascorbate peroxidase